MVKKTPGPLDQSDLKKINDILAAMAETRDYCNKVGGCGIDVAREAALTEEGIEILTRIKAAFFPNSR